MNAVASWLTSRFDLGLEVPLVMGIVNLTPDSFSDGGRLDGPSAAIRHCERLVAEGADILDLGAESTRPGAQAVPADLEWARLEPVIREVLSFGVPVSVDTRKAAVIERALAAGADIVNDVAALRDPGSLAAVAAHPRCGVCLMHMLEDPQSMQRRPAYRDVVETVRRFLSDRLQVCVDAGIDARRIVLDPGIGFGKTPDHNLTLTARLAELLSIGRPLLMGWSRKSTLEAVTGRPVGERLPASLSAALACVARGAQVLRVHDVAATRDALRVWHAIAAGAVENPANQSTGMGS